jgi:hypothetical protein
VQKYSVKPQNQYNINKKGIIRGFISKVKVIILKYKKKVYIT